MFRLQSPSCQIPHLDLIYEKYFHGKDNGVFIEVGANDGYAWSNTWGLAELGWTGIYYEPVSELVEKCRERHLQNNVTVVQTCVGAYNGSTKLYLGTGVTSSSEVAENDIFWYGNTLDKFVMSPVCKLETSLEELDVSHEFDLLVIDVDGSELDVLAGINLSIWAPKMIIIETCKDSVLLGWNFNALKIDRALDNYYVEIYHDHINSIYIRKEGIMASLFSQKQDAIIGYAKEHKCKTLVETGTGQGDMIAATLGEFDWIYSIDLSNEACLSAANRFRIFDKVIILYGDSGEVLSQIVPLLSGPTLFFLDAHYCGGYSARGDTDTPILHELEILVPNLAKDDVILIDDWVHFGSNPEYPTPAELIAFVNSLDRRISFEVITNGGGMAVLLPSRKAPLRVKVVEIKDVITLPRVMASERDKGIKQQRRQIDSVGYMAPSSTGGSGQNRNQVNQTNQSGKKRR